MSDNTRDYAEYLRERAHGLGVDLPPVGRTPRRWPWFFVAPDGDPVELSDNPRRFLMKAGRQALPVMALQTVMRTIESVATAFVPVVMAAILNGILSTGFTTSMWQQFGIFMLLLVTTAFTAALADLFDVGSWLQAGLQSTRAVGRRAIRAGRAVKEREGAGDLVTSLANDSDKLGQLALMVPNAIGATVAIVVALVIMFSISVPMALVVALGVPLSMLAVAAVTRPLERRIAVRRERVGEMTTVASDAVVGLRVLRGIGAEDAFFTSYQQASDRVRDSGKKAAFAQALLSTLAATLPQLIAALVVALGAYLTFDGQLNVGDYAAFFVYAWLVRSPVSMMADLTFAAASAWPGIKKMAKMWTFAPATSDGDGDVDLDWSQVTLRDESKGISIAPGKVTGVASESPEAGARLARKLARTDDDYHVSADGVDIRSLPVAAVREAIHLSDATIQVFAGTLQGAIEGAQAPPVRMRGVSELVYRETLEQATDVEGSLWQKEETRMTETMRQAIEVADAADVVAAIDGGLTGSLTEKGRNVSGGQRQRIALARAVHASAPILILVQPTSAVDAHTEARIGAKLAQHRRGMTTVVVTTSPLLLGECDEIIVVDAEGNEVARGTHAHLLEESPHYQEIIDREVN